MQSWQLQEASVAMRPPQLLHLWQVIQLLHVQDIFMAQGLDKLVNEQPPRYNCDEGHDDMLYSRCKLKACALRYPLQLSVYALLGITCIAFNTHDAQQLWWQQQRTTCRPAAARFHTVNDAAACLLAQLCAC